MLTRVAHSLIPLLPSLIFHPPPSVLLALAAFIHPCHFVISFLLYSFASKTAASSLLRSFSYHSDTLLLSLPLIMHLFFFLLNFLFFFFPFPFSCSSSSYLPSFALHLLFPPSFFLPPLSIYIFLNVSLSLFFFSFTLNDGSIDSLYDDIAQGQPQGREPL